jgi:CubicO group peptidase (beta-lactamase class C family)
MNKYSILLLILCYANPVSAQSLEHQVDAAIKPLLKEYPGIQIAVGSNDSIILEKSYGYSDLAKKMPTENDDLFRIYSISKLITTIGLLQLMENGQLDPDETIETYIPSWDETRINPWPTKITPRHLALHRSGIRHYSGIDEVYTSQQCNEVKEGVSFFDQSYLLFEPGTQKSYSSWGYVLLSRLIEIVADTSYQEYVKTRIFDPINLQHILLYDRSRLMREAHIYERDQRGAYQDVTFVNPSCKFGAGGFISNAADLVKIGMAFNDGQLISPEMVKLAMEGDISNNIFIVGGVSAGSRAILGINIITGHSMVILGNQRGPSFNGIVEEILTNLK